jgi:hypothetical protein
MRLYRFLRLLISITFLIITAISSWFLGVKLHRRIRREIGHDVDNEVELTSLNTWMKVEDVEELDQSKSSGK